MRIAHSLCLADQIISAESGGAAGGGKKVMRFQSYIQREDLYDVTFLPNGSPKERAHSFVNRLSSLAEGELEQYQRAADSAMLHMGIIFNVYNKMGQAEQIFPFDIIPRIIDV